MLSDDDDTSLSGRKKKKLFTASSCSPSRKSKNNPNICYKLLKARKRENKEKRDEHLTLSKEDYLCIQRWLLISSFVPARSQWGLKSIRMLLFLHIIRIKDACCVVHEHLAPTSEKEKKTILPKFLIIS